MIEADESTPTSLCCPPEQSRYRTGSHCDTGMYGQFHRRGAEDPADSIIAAMVEKLVEGMAIFAQCAGDLKDDPAQSEKTFEAMRQTHSAIEQFYRDGMTHVFSGNDAMRALRQREVYHHIKDASSHLDDTVDILHRVVVRLT